MSYYDKVKDTVAALVMFYSPDSTASIKMRPVLQEIRNEASGSVQVLEVNIDDDTNIVKREHITSLPAFAVYRYGRCVWRGSGIQPKDALLRRLEASADPTPADELGHHHKRSKVVA